MTACLAAKKIVNKDPYLIKASSNFPNARPLTKRRSEHVPPSIAVHVPSSEEVFFFIIIT